VLRNETHKLEHHMSLKIENSSPDVPLPTLKLDNQFAVVGGSARFYCEAFIGKKELPDMEIGIKWYRTLDGDEQEISEDWQEIVKREDEQIVGSYLNIPSVTVSHFGRYLCRIEIGNSPTHRLNMSADLINALPIIVEDINLLLDPYFLAVCAFVATISIISALVRFTRLCSKNTKELESLPLTLRQKSKNCLSLSDEVKVLMIDLHERR